MTLENAINLYVQRKQARGISFAKGCQIYRAFLKTVGNLSLARINVDHVLNFLSRFETSDAFRKRHSLLRHFFDYWALHGEIAELPMPVNRPRQRSTFLPYIYTKKETSHSVAVGPVLQDDK